MTPELRLKNLIALLGWQGGTVHDACREIGVDPQEFLSADEGFIESGPCVPFRIGYQAAQDGTVNKIAWRGNIQYWFGAIAALQNGLSIPVSNKDTVLYTEHDLLVLCQALVKWCDENPPAGESLWFVNRAREVVSKAIGEKS